MNCKENDLAVVVRDTYSLGGCNFIGTPVKVTTSFKTEFFGRDAWKLARRVRCQNCGAMLDAMYDADLQPIRGISAGTNVTTEQPVETLA